MLQESSTVRFMATRETFLLQLRSNSMHFPSEIIKNGTNTLLSFSFSFLWRKKIWRSSSLVSSFFRSLFIELVTVGSTKRTREGEKNVKCKCLIKNVLCPYDYYYVPANGTPEQRNKKKSFWCTLSRAIHGSYLNVRERRTCMWSLRLLPHEHRILLSLHSVFIFIAVRHHKHRY